LYWKVVASSDGRNNDLERPVSLVAGPLPYIIKVSVACRKRVRERERQRETERDREEGEGERTAVVSRWKRYGAFFEFPSSSCMVRIVDKTFIT
jgi:hypothetical protein